MDNLKSPRHLVTIKIASDILQVSATTLRKWDKTGLLKSVRDKLNGYRLYNISQLEKFAKLNHLKRFGRKLHK